MQIWSAKFILHFPYKDQFSKYQVSNITWYMIEQSQTYRTVGNGTKNPTDKKIYQTKNYRTI